ncbi:MAG: Com family DNA-binding transcriptional regulator [Undibacterium sp.]|uniref:Com family DNA-binding transcriptional regulator n=1 Tax=Undibacterium sp. TaxID=1914977 RepID=UPI002720BD5F|nr:Com family DNA-binding transcriptional regulator [Undibacterium sp.]MDO8654177.1 Com family DNA-binding transcriptional regulator [Undibacterium sp.]
MQDIRCGNCHKKLAEGEYRRLNIKCPRCSTLNQLSAASATPERLRAPIEANSNDESHHPMARRQAPLSR